MQSVQVSGTGLVGTAGSLGGKTNFLVLKVIGFGIFFLRNSFPFDRATLGAVHSNALLMSWTLQGADTRL